MLFITRAIVQQQIGYDEWNDILIRLYFGFVFPMNKIASKGFWIDRKMIRTLM